MFCSTPQSLAEIMSHEYEIKGKKKAMEKEKKKKRNVPGSRESKPEAIAS